MNFKVYEFYLEFMNKGFSFIKNSGITGISANEASFIEFLKIINFVRDQFEAIAYALSISFMFFSFHF